MKEGVERRLVATLVLAGVGVAFAGVAGLRNVGRFDEATGLVAHTHQVLSALADVALLMTEAQSASRALAVTGDGAYATAYAEMAASLEPLLLRLRTLVADNPAQQQRLSRLEQLVHESFANRSALVRLVQERGAAAGRAEIASGRGAREMDVIRASLSEIREAEETLLAARQAESKAADRALVRTGLALTALVLVVLGAGGLMIRQSLGKKLQAEAERDHFFTASLDMLCISSADGYFKRLSPAYTRTLGWEVEELLSRPFLDFVHPDDHAATLREVERQVKAGEPVLQFENRYRHKDGSYRLLSWRSVPDSSGLMYATARDVTDRRLAEEAVKSLNAELKAQAAQLQAANHELESFAYSVSHDLRSPLRAIDGFAQALIEDYGGSLDDVGQGYLRRVRGGAQRMGHLIDDLLKLSRVSRAEMTLETVDLAALGRRVVSDLQREAAGRKVQWEIGGPFSASGDPRLLQIALENLLDNALKFTRSVDVARIAFGCESREGEAVFFVRDNGAGFDMAHSSRLFGAFQRLHTAQEFPGTGIGLATVQRVIHRHGGRIWAEASPGHGATFYFTLGTTAL